MQTFDESRPKLEPYGFTCVLWQPTPMPRPDQHNEIEVNFLPKGSVTYLFGGRPLIVKAHQFTLFWAAIPHQIVESDTKDPYYVMTIPLAWFLQWRMPSSFAQTVLHGDVVVDEMAKATRLESQLAQWTGDLQNTNNTLKEVVLLEVQARFMRAWLHANKSAGRRTSNNRLSLPEGARNKVEAIAAYVAQHYAQPLTVGQIASAIGLNPDYTSHVFHKTFGITIMAYLMQHRLSHAQRLLVTSDLKIIDVALEAGFNSTSHFNAAFKGSNGCTPSAYRKRHLGRSDWSDDAVTN